MTTDVSCPPSFKRRRLPGNLAAHISKAPTCSWGHYCDQDEDDDDIYEFTADDYYQILNNRNKMRSAAEEQQVKADKGLMTTAKKAVIRVRCPDGKVLEETFHSWEKIQSLIDFLSQRVSRPFKIYTTPPKNIIRDTSVDFYSAGFVPGAIVYLSYL